MIAAWAAVEDLVRRRALHRKGFRAGEVPIETILEHAQGELDELKLEPGDRKELADLFGVLIHYAIKQGWSMIDIQRDVIEKLSQRFS